MINTIDLINKKKSRQALTYEELEHLVNGYTDGTVPDYQMAAFLMAVIFQGMDRDETVAMTQIMKKSGDIMDLSTIEGIKVDKHSTGGVGDKTTLIIGPVAAACGVPVAKMSGRGLGFTGGTIDKLESIPGYRTSMDEREFIDQVNRIGIAVIGQTGTLAPADKKIYALRDATSTVDDLSLITASIMSKKLATGSDAILLDVKCGSGAFMKTQEDAEKLAEMMVEIGRADGREMVAVISDMDQPLGNAIGNSLEVMEAIDVLKGKGPEDITELSVNLAGIMIYLGKKAGSIEEGVEKARKAIEDGSALEKLRELIAAQGGDPDVTEDYLNLPQSDLCMNVEAWQDGYIVSMDAMKIGQASQNTGAGRSRKDDELDLAAGIVLCKKTGDFVRKGESLAKLYCNNAEKAEKAVDELKNAVKINKEQQKKHNLIRKIMR